MIWNTSRPEIDGAGVRRKFATPELHARMPEIRPTSNVSETTSASDVRAPAPPSAPPASAIPTPPANFAAPLDRDVSYAELGAIVLLD